MDKQSIINHQLSTQDITPEALGHIRALAAEHNADLPKWCARRRRIRHTTLASMAVVAVMGISFLTVHLSIPKGYDAVVCNRSGIADTHWVNVASTILTTPTF